MPNPSLPRLIACAALLAAAPAFAQTAQVTAADYARAETMLAHNVSPLVDGAVSGVTWLDDGSVWFRRQDAGAANFIRHEVATSTSSRLFDRGQLSKSLARVAGKPVSIDQLAASAVTAEPDGTLSVRVGEARYSCAPQSRGGACSKAAPAPKEPGVRSPDGKREAFIRGWNLWLRTAGGGNEVQLTTDGATDYGYATDNAGWTHSDRAILVWSPGSDKIATFQQDQRKTSTMTLVATNVGAPKVEQWKYPFAGDDHVTMIERVVIDLGGEQPKTIRLQLPPDQHRSTFCDDVSCNGGWEDVQWAADGKTLAFVSTDRAHKWAQLRVADAATGAVRDVYRETVKTQYESGQGEANWRYLPESNEFLWYSARDDWGHLSLHDLASGKRKRQLTSGHWNVTQLAHLDLATRTVFFRGVGREAGRDPYFVHYYRVGLDGGEVRLLTPEDANHKVTPSKDDRYFVDEYSTVATAPVVVVRDAEGRQLAELARADLTRLKAAGWVPPEPFTVNARDGKTTLYGQLFKPAAFDAARKYPVVTYIYPGPQVGSIRSRSFEFAHLDHQALAELGFVVIALDGTCTPLRSKSFHDACYGNMADNTLPDQVAALKQLAARHPWIDASRAGIWGHSGGGNATAAAMFRYPDVYKVGIAQSGNHDNLSYEDDWAERYQGLLVKQRDGSSNYTGQDNASIARQLKGRLLLMHGLMDDNVPPQNTLLVVDALVKANKDFDLLLLPHARHGYGRDGFYVMRRRWDYFVQYLMGATPPAGYQIKAPQP